MKENENKNQQNTEGQQEQTQKKERFLKRTWKRFRRDLLDIGIGIGIGAVVAGSVFTARSRKATEETESEADDQQTDSYDEDDISEVSDE